MSITQVNMAGDKPVQTRILTVAELAEQLNHLVATGRGQLPVFTSDGRGLYPFSTVIPLTPSGYADYLAIKPAAHLHAQEVDRGNKRAEDFARINADADRIRASCGAFHP